MLGLPVWTLVSFLLLLQRCRGDLEIQKLEVPRLAELHQPARLSCKFRLDGVSLYFVKWYKDDEEFFRINPNDKPTKMSFPVPGIQVLLNESDTQTVALKNVSRVSAGVYTCEVASDAPQFYQANARANMDVYSLPDRLPEIEIEKASLYSGERINAICSSGRSHPKQTLSWFLNGIQVNSSSITLEKTTVTGSGLFRTYSNISLAVSGLPSPILLSCVASIDPVLPNYRGQVNLYLQGEPKSFHLTNNSTEKIQKGRQTSVTWNFCDCSICHKP